MNSLFISIYNKLKNNFLIKIDNLKYILIKQYLLLQCLKEKLICKYEARNGKYIKNVSIVRTQAKPDSIIGSFISDEINITKSFNKMHEMDEIRVKDMFSFFLSTKSDDFLFNGGDTFHLKVNYIDDNGFNNDIYLNENDIIRLDSESLLKRITRNQNKIYKIYKIQMDENDRMIKTIFPSALKFYSDITAREIPLCFVIDGISYIEFDNDKTSFKLFQSDNEIGNLETFNEDDGAGVMIPLNVSDENLNGGLWWWSKK
jgi:hypothetical protein